MSPAPAASARVAATTTAGVAAASPATTVLGESRMRGDGEGGSERKCGHKPKRRKRKDPERRKRKDSTRRRGKDARGRTRAFQ